MITKDYVVTMARYNSWQNRQLSAVVEGMAVADLDLDRGAFFGSIRGTLNHLLWGDTLWMARFCDDVTAPATTPTTGVELTPTIAVWSADRFRMDGRIRMWAETLSNMDLVGDLTWFSAAEQAHRTQPLAACIVGFFNHQTHHRGQVHAMLTAAGMRAPVSDLVYMQESD